MKNVNKIEEIWKDIIGYEGLYQVSNFGNVKSLPRVIHRINGTIQTVKERILKPAKISGGYLQVNLYKDGKKKLHLIHRLVASAFIDNPDNFKEVNHIDEDKTNNNVDNLEWCSAKYNCNYGSRTERQAKYLSKQVAQIDKKTGEIIRIWLSTAEAGRNGFDASSVAKCCNAKLNYKTHKGYIWKYI